ncbi:MAG: YigZ family protein [Defluviitaleaceae bacterium]|nr:YigZ family protein [Defluviitaleaceae bacterium]
MLERFTTIYKHAEIEIIEKKSRFIGQAFPVESEEEALAILANVHKTHAKAVHNCFAWQIGEANQFARQSDDGEPSGTAGMPILDYLRKEGIKNTLVIVTRYFGGTLLGTGGLVRAYGRAAKEAAEASPIIEKVLYAKMSIKCPYNLQGKLQYEILHNGHVLHDTLFTDNVEFVVLTESVNENSFAKAMAEASSGIADIRLINKLYCAQIEGELIIF